MSTDLQVPDPVAVADVAEDVQLIARSPGEMREAQQSLAAWCNAKVAILDRDVAELAENIDIAIKNGWKVDTLDRHHAIAVKRRDYYAKIKLAVEAGYCVVPNFPIDVFAVRTKRAMPLKKDKDVGAWVRRREEPSGLPIGEGNYVDPEPITETYISGHHKHPTTGQLITERRRYSVQFQDEIEFPISVAKPLIMSETARAMALKCFDEIGVLPERAGVKGDPLVVARIVLPKSVKMATFLIAWYVDTKDL